MMEAVQVEANNSCFSSLKPCRTHKFGVLWFHQTSKGTQMCVFGWFGELKTPPKHKTQINVKRQMLKNYKVGRERNKKGSGQGVEGVEGREVMEEGCWKSSGQIYSGHCRSKH